MKFRENLNWHFPNVRPSAISGKAAVLQRQAVMGYILFQVERVNLPT